MSDIYYNTKTKEIKDDKDPKNPDSWEEISFPKFYNNWYNGTDWIEKGTIDQEALWDRVTLEITYDENKEHLIWKETNKKTGGVIHKETYPIQRDYFYNTGAKTKMVTIKGVKDSIIKKDMQFKIGPRDFSADWNDYRNNDNIKDYDYEDTIFTNNIRSTSEEDQDQFNNILRLKNCIFPVECDYISDGKVDIAVHIEDCVFLKQICIHSIKFEGKIVFTNNVFTNKAHFTGIKSTIISFNNNYALDAITMKHIDTEVLDLSHSKMNTLSFDSVGQIQHIKTYQTDISKADNYQIFTILKNFALKNHNTIQALDYHVKECNTHLKELLGKDNNTISWISRIGKICILAFSKYTTQHGTNPLQGLLCLLALHISFAIISISYNDITFNDITFSNALYYSITDTLSIDKNNLCLKKWLILFKDIFHYILLYSVIQSFRQFNRKF